MLFKTIDSLESSYLDLLEDICNIESPTNFKEGIDKVGSRLIDFAKNKGWKVDLLQLEAAGNPIVITMNPEAKLEPVIFSGHIDTVHPIGLFKTPAVTRKDGIMYGPGVLDCKGGVVASLLAMDALEKCEFKARPVKLIIQTDEETGSRTSGKKTVEYMIEHSKGAIAFFNTEAISKKTCVTLARKGIARFEFRVRGVAGHSASCYEEGASAILEAAHKIIELEKFKEKDGITCNCGVISGGTVANSVAEECTFLADFRYKTTEELDTLQKAVRTIAEAVYTHDTTCEAVKISDRPCMPLVEKNLALFEKLNEIHNRVGLPAYTYREALGGSDAAYITIADIPCIDSIGPSGGRCHSVDEFLEMDSIADCAKRLATVTVNI